MVGKRNTFDADECVGDVSDKGVNMEPKKTKKKPKSKAVVKNVNELEDESSASDNLHIGKVTYFNKETMVVGIRCDGIGYQTKARKDYFIGDNVVFSVKDGEVIAE